MLAIHNYQVLGYIKENVANAFAKLSKCQQFTTILILARLYYKLQTLLQSYQNVSNSQLGVIRRWYKGGCKRFCKVIKMLAIHNLYEGILNQRVVANAFAKLSKCQQFTTKPPCLLVLRKLQTLLQSYQNVSNSQPTYNEV